MKTSNNRLASGFTLIEIMIVILIIGVLMAIAYPSYQNHVIKTRRATAAGCALEAAQFLERFYTTNLRYDQDRDGNAPDIPDCSSPMNGFYVLSTPTLAERQYTITMTPQGRQAARDTECAALSVTQAGIRSISGTGSEAACW